MLHVVRRAPEHFGYARSRWTLPMILASCEWLRVETLGGLSQLLTRLGISYKRGRDYVHSPDLHYEAKVAAIQQACAQAEAAPNRFVVLYLDELTFYRQPSLGCAYEAMGPVQPLALRSHRSNTTARILATLNHCTGQVLYRQSNHTTIATLANFWSDVAQVYAEAERIDIVVDNWPLHYHPDVLAPLQAQAFAHPPALPANWPTQPSAHAKHDNLPIRLLPLPTYASWLNPIEKLWRKLKQEWLHLHRYSDDWLALKAHIAAFLDTFATGSDALLRYVGLLPI